MTAAIPGPVVCDVQVLLSRSEVADEDTRRSYVAIALQQSGGRPEDVRVTIAKLEPNGRQFLEDRPGFIELWVRHPAGTTADRLQLVSEDVWRELNGGLVL